jgi:hypothetical protein
MQAERTDFLHIAGLMPDGDEDELIMFRRHPHRHAP